MLAQDCEHSQSAAAFAFLSQPAQCVFHNGCRPSHVENSFGRTICQFAAVDRQMRRRFSHPFVPSDKLHFAAALLPASKMVFVLQKIFHRRSQKRSKATTTGISQREQIAFKQRHKKILSEILGVGDGVTSPADQRENWSPVGAAEFGYGSVGLLR